MPHNLTFTIHPADELSSLELLATALADIRKLVGHVDDAIYGPRQRQEWVVENLRSSAPTISVRPGRDDGQAVDIVSHGLAVIMEGVDAPPPHFSEPAVKAVKTLRRWFDRDRRAQFVTVTVDDQEITTIREEIAKFADHILAKSLHNLGSIQGTLEAINVHKSHKATVWDGVTKAPVSFDFADKYTDHIKQLLEKRVLVTGRIHYFYNGTPRSISGVTAIEEDSSKEPGDYRDLFGSLPDPRVKEMGVDAFLREIRGYDKD